MMQKIPEGTPYRTWYDEDGFQHVKFLIEDNDNNPSEPSQHLISVGNKTYHAEMYIKQTEHDKIVIADAVRHIEAYIDRNKKNLTYFDAAEQRQGMTVNDVIYFLNKIKECVKE